MKGAGVADTLGGRAWAALALVTIAGGLASVFVAQAVWGAALTNAVAVLLCFALDRLAAHLWPGRPVSLVRLALFLLATQPLAILFLALAEGQLDYETMKGRFSLATEAAKVAAVTLELGAAALAGAFLVGRTRGRSPLSLHQCLDTFTGEFRALACWVSAGILVSRFVLLFYAAALPDAFTYLLRLFIGYFMPTFLLAGAALRNGHRAASVVVALLGLTVPLVVLSGSRGDALMPVILLGLGYVAARPMQGRRLLRLSLVAGAAFATVMFVGEVARSDQQGRTGEAALQRVNSIQAAFQEHASAETARSSTLRRLISFSTHSVVTRIPVEVPFEADGLWGLPADFLDKFLPRFNWSGISDTELPRNFMLNDLGFLVAWGTAVELTLLADAWYRGGYLGVFVVGLLLGMLLQSVEDRIYLRLGRRPELMVVLLFVMTTLFSVVVRDFVLGVRSILFMLVTSLLLAFAAAGLRGRQRRQNQARVAAAALAGRSPLLRPPRLVG